MSKPKKQKASKVVSAKELKSWLRGAMEFQPENWTPNAEQWAAIRDRIFNLDENEAGESYHYVQEPQHAVQTYTPVAVPTPAYAAAVPVQAPQSVLGGSAAAAPQAPSGALALPKSPTESGMVPVSSQNTVLEGDYKSPF